MLNATLFSHLKYMYPPISPYHVEKIHVDTLKDGRKVEVYYEMSGNPDGIPVIYLHGGPGDSSSPRLRQLYDPKKYNIILFDQRGCGKSSPPVHTEKNTTQLLVRDMEEIRLRHGIESMVVAGGSWGTSLALVYAISHPKQTRGLILRGFFDLSTDKCVVYSMFPEVKDDLFRLLKLKPTASNHSLMLKTQRLLKTKSRKRVIQTVSKFDNAAYVKMKMKPDTFQEKERFVVLGTHYEVNHFFVKKHYIDRNLHKINHIPTIMVAGRYDIVTPIEMAYLFSKRMKHCKLWIVEGGHSVFDKPICDAVIKASDLIISLL